MVRDSHSPGLSSHLNNPPSTLAVIWSMAIVEYKKVLKGIDTLGFNARIVKMSRVKVETVVDAVKSVNKMMNNIKLA